MILITKENQYVDFQLSENQKVGNGAFGKVFKISPERCLKVLLEPESLPDAEKVITFLKEHNLPSFYRIYNNYYNNEGMLNAYEMKYYEKQNELLLYKLMEYYLDNFIQNSKDLTKISENNIKVCDVRGENVILTPEKIVLIDADCYTISSENKKEVERKNQDELKWLYINLLLREILDVTNYNCDIVRNIREGLVNIFIKNSPEDIYKQLKIYKRPVDLVRRLERKR